MSLKPLTPEESEAVIKNGLRKTLNAKPIDSVNVESKAYTEIKRLAEKYPDNEFLAISAEMTPPDYQASDLENTEYLFQEALKYKYQL